MRGLPNCNLPKGFSPPEAPIGRLTLRFAAVTGLRGESFARIFIPAKPVERAVREEVQYERIRLDR